MHTVQDPTGRRFGVAASSTATFVHDLASRLGCSKCAKAGRRPFAVLLQLMSRPPSGCSGDLIVCNLYSRTKNVDAIRRLFGALNSDVGKPRFFSAVRP
jgi:hypothetical protein